MVQNQETIEVEKHPSTMHSKLLVHKQWVPYQGTVLQNTKFWDASSEMLPCRQASPCTSPYWTIQINPMIHTALKTEEDFQNQILLSNPAETS